MSGVTVQYKGNTIASMADSAEKTLKTSGKYCEGDVVVKYEKPATSEMVSGTKSITANGEHDVSAYAKANVNVPIPSGYIKPSGTKEITENGTHDVTNYASVNVNVASEAEEPNCLIVEIDGATIGTAWQTICKSDLIAQHIDNLHCYWQCIGDDGSTSGQNIMGGRASTYPIFKGSGTPYYQIVNYYNSSRSGVAAFTFTTSLVNDMTSTPSNSGFLKVKTDGTVQMFVKSANKLLACKYRFVFTW